MAEPLTNKQIADTTGRSVTWLRTHTCGLCDQTALQACRGGCASIYGRRCTAADRIKSVTKGGANG